RKTGSGRATSDRRTVGEQELDGGRDERDERRDDERVQRARAERDGEPDGQYDQPDQRDRPARRSHSTRTDDSAARITSRPVSSLSPTGRTRWARVTTASCWMSSGTTYSRPSRAARAWAARSSDSDPRGLTPSWARSRV